MARLGAKRLDEITAKDVDAVLVELRSDGEPGGRVAYLLAEEERAVLDALAPAFRPHFPVRVNTGLRYSEQMTLRWRGTWTC